MDTHDIVPTHLVVKAMRDSGYKNAAYAIAELMDNAIQANASKVELLCAEQVELLAQRQRSRVFQIAVLDNGCGMDKDVLRLALQFGNGTRLNDYSGIGRFGMGLPNSSISQARRVEVWTWQDGPDTALYSYIDIDEIETGTLRQVPEPKSLPIPDLWREVGQTFEKSGTIVVWSVLDRIMWRTAKAILDNSELLIGRMYRYFLADHQIQIRLVSFDAGAKALLRRIDEKWASPNDPLYLLSNTSCPDPFDKTAMFEQKGYEDTQFDILFNGKTHPVIVRFSYAKEEAREGMNPGSLPHGQHAKRNVGVSLMRAGRELDLDPAWSDPAEVRDRWWGVEVVFPPSLDDLFGVTNNKQSARHFSELAKVDLESMLEEGQTLGSLREALDADADPRLPLLEIAQHIKKNISTIRRLIRAQTALPKRKRHDDIPSEEIGTEATRKRIEDGFAGVSDRQEEKESPEVRQEEIAEELIGQGVAKKQAEELAAKTVGRGLKYTFVKADLATPAFFDVKSTGGAVIITLNMDHPAYSHLVELLQQDVDEVDESELRTRLVKARGGLELLLMAWARHEDEQPDTGRRRDQVREARWDWGRMARQFLQHEEDL